jgi:predicted transcriptional regulator
MALLLAHEYVGYTQIKSALERSASTVCGHLSRLLSSGIISRKRVDGVWIYGIKEVDKAAMILNRDSINKIYAEK